MPDKLSKDSAGVPGDADEIDALIASLPSLHIPSDMIDDADFLPPRKPVKTKTDVVSVFTIIAWGFLVFALLTVTRAYPSQMVFFQTYTGPAGAAAFNLNYIINAVIYLAGNCAVCAGGLAICALRKRKMFRGAALSFWIAGGSSAVIAAILAIAHF
jgi:hypothetical protein